MAETGLHTLLELLQNVQASTVMNAFYVQYYLGLLQDVFAVLTLEGSVNARNHVGGTAPAQVKAAVVRGQVLLASR